MKIILWRGIIKFIQYKYTRDVLYIEGGLAQTTYTFLCESYLISDWIFHISPY